MSFTEPTGPRRTVRAQPVPGYGVSTTSGTLIPLPPGPPPSAKPATNAPVGTGWTGYKNKPHSSPLEMPKPKPTGVKSWLTGKYRKTTRRRKTRRHRL